MSQWMTELCEGLGSEGGTRGPQEGEDPRGPGRAGRGREDEKTSGEETRARAGPGPTESAFLSSSMTLKGAAASLGIGTFASSFFELRAASALSFPPFSVAALAESLVTLPKANLLRRFPVGGLSAGFTFTFTSSVLVALNIKCYYLPPTNTRPLSGKSYLGSLTRGAGQAAADVLSWKTGHVMKYQVESETRSMGCSLSGSLG